MFPRALLMTIFAAVALAGCGPLKMPDPPTPIDSPQVEVRHVRMVATGPDASRYLITLKLVNPNDFALPLIDAEYRFESAGNTYVGDTHPNATLPASGEITIELPAVLPLGGESYDVTGSVKMHPPGQIKQLYYEAGGPRPRVDFAASGTIDVVAGTAATNSGANATPAPIAEPAR